MTTYAVLNEKTVRPILNAHRSTLEALHKIEDDLKSRFILMDDPVRALILAVATGEPMLFIGPPGTAKSRLIRAFCEWIGVIDRNKPTKHPDYFEYLLTPFTEPSELFGYFNIEQAQRLTRLVRDTTNMMQQAKVVYLDEVFNGSSAILNSILAFMNERVFHDRGQIIDVKMQCMFGSTNIIPETSELRAVYDRFLIRCVVTNLEATPRRMVDLVTKGWTETYSDKVTTPFTNLLDDLENFRNDLAQKADAIFYTSDSNFYGRLAQVVHEVRRRGLSEMSNRRMVKFLNLMLVHALYMGVQTPRAPIAISDRELALWRFVVDRRNPVAETHLPREA